jgi:hypothetical protein
MCNQRKLTRLDIPIKAIGVWDTVGEWLFSPLSEPLPTIKPPRASIERSEAYGIMGVLAPTWSCT